MKARLEPFASKQVVPTIRLHLVPFRCSPTLLKLLVTVACLLTTARTDAAGLRAGVAKVDITNTQKRPVHDRLYARALVLKNDSTTVVLVTLDVVAIGEIGPIPNTFLGNLRQRIQQQLHIRPEHVLVTASHCHGSVCTDVEQRAFAAVKTASSNLVPVRAGAGCGREDRIMINRRLRLKDGTELDIRRAYSMPPDSAVAAVGPIDPQIGILRLDRKDGQPLAVIYNFACHPIEGAPDGGNTADITGYASRVIEENLGHGAVALFVQGCAGDINPIWYKDVAHPYDAEPLGNRLGLSTLRALHQIHCKDDDRLVILNQTLDLPRADYAQRIRQLETERERLVNSLRGTSLNLKTFLPLAVKYGLGGDYPSYYAHLYLHEHALGRKDLTTLDARNRADLKRYIHNIHTMEAITRLQTNLALLRKHQAAYEAAPRKIVHTELCGLRVGDFVLLTFPGELTVQIGLNLKQKSPHRLTFIAGYTNGYIYYTPTAKQLKNVGRAQEDSDCIVAPQWQAIFERNALAILQNL